MVLAEDAPIGMTAADYFNIDAPDWTITIGLTPNRSDDMSHIGVEEDVCAYINHHQKANWKVRLPELKEHTTTAQHPIKIEVLNQDACPRYMGAVISGVQIAPSPEWLQLKLKAIGLRPINNIVDITNFVLHEYGQPLHAFDYDTIADAHIKVQFLAEGTPFITLDNTERTLRSEDLMICDAEKALCMA